MKYVEKYCDFERTLMAEEFYNIIKRFHTQDFFKLFEIIDQKILRVKERRLSALLQNFI